VKADSVETAKIVHAGGFIVVKQKGTVTWNIQLPAAGVFRVRIGYASDQPGTKVQISGLPTQNSTELPATRGFFIPAARAIPRGAEFLHGFPGWLQQNYERRDIGTTIALNAGENSINLAIYPPSKDIAFYLSSIELLPVTINPWTEAREAQAQRANPDWLMHAGYGLMFHWTAQTMPRFGPQMKYVDAVEAFNVPAFAHMVQKTGANYVIFTANHQDPHFPAPLKEWEAVHPGWTIKRDLIGEIAEALNTRGIKLILYINTPGMGNFYTPGMGNHPNASEPEFISTVIKLITEVGKRYRTSIAGYWLDSFNYIDPHYPHFPFKRFYDACKAGYAHRLIALNTWILPIDTLWQDYWAGELVTTGNPPTSLPMSYGPARGLPFHALLTLFGDWVHIRPNKPIKPPIFTVDELSNLINATKGKGAVTINTGIYQDGSIGKEQTLFFEQLRKRVYGH
jgi:hypothetical protein